MEETKEDRMRTFTIQYVSSGRKIEVKAVSLFQVIKAHFPQAIGGQFDEPHGLGEVWNEKRLARAYIREVK
jgi:hypothetical protein